MKIRARQEDLVVQDVNGELFIYDLKTDKVYSLNSTSAFVWNHLDGETAVEDLATRLGREFKQSVGIDLIWLTIDTLRQANLLEEENLPQPLSKLKRREAIKRIGLASLIALPMISMLVAPTALSAASGGNAAVCQPCTAAANNTQGTCAPGQGNCKVNYATGGSKICGVNTKTNSTYPPGYQSFFRYNSQAGCNTYGQRYCCRGTATFNGGDKCICN